MILKNTRFFFVIILFITTGLYAQNTNPEVTNVAFSISGTTVTVTFDVADAEQSTVTTQMEVSSDNGATWNFDFGVAVGDIGSGVATGTGKTIAWTYSGGFNNQFIVRVFANDETAGGSPCAGVETVDYDGTTYNTVQIGNQCWLKENLNAGTTINKSSNQLNNSILEKYCYEDNPANCTIYGGLYQWAEMVQYQNGATNTTSPSPAFSGNIQGICPAGWHIPSREEYILLSEQINNNGNPLKAIGQGTGDGAGTNTSGFSALLGGFGAPAFSQLGLYGVFWVTTDANTGNSYDIYVINGDDIFELSDVSEKGSCFSARCLKD